MTAGATLSWDVFCGVVDNYGDAGVCWRLARQLAIEHAFRVRLWVDDLATLNALCPQVNPDAPVQVVNGVQVFRWRREAPFIDGFAVADIAVDAFGTGLPDTYVAAMVQRQPSPLWITLEYLSAEPWVAGHHGLPSPHPDLPLRRFFFFPGFDPDTGGLLRETDLFERRDVFQRDPASQARFWQEMGFGSPSSDTIVISLFGYENPVIAQLLEIWAFGNQSVVIAVPPSRLRPQVSAFFGRTGVVDNVTLRRGKIEARFIPFLSQDRYDNLLWACDWNFVRGEDSFVRAQWAARPLVWHIYPQEERAHWPKLDAFLERYCANLEGSLNQALRSLLHAWNGSPESTLTAADWHFLMQSRQQLLTHAHKWADSMTLTGDMTANLVQFCKSKVK